MQSLSKITSSLFLTSSLFFIGGCGSGSGGSGSSPTPPPATQPVGTAVTGSGSAGTPTTPSVGGTTAPPSGGATTSPVGGAASFNCGTAWKTYVAANPAGLSLAYKVTTETKDTGGVVLNSSSRQTETKIIESSDARVVTSDGELSKAQFLEACGKVGGPEFGGLAAQVTVLEKGPRTITVPAGTFATDYSKSSVVVGSSQGESTISSWTLSDGSGINVKSDVTVKSSAAGFSFESHTVTELVKIIRP